MSSKIIIMEALQQSYTSISFARESKKDLVHEFFDWCKTQEKNRLLWLAIIIATHACIITPLTVLIILFSGNSMLFWALTIAAMTMALVTNLAALPAKITIPVFFLSLLIDIIVIINCVPSLLFAGT